MKTLLKQIIILALVASASSHAQKALPQAARTESSVVHQKAFCAGQRLDASARAQAATVSSSLVSDTLAAHIQRIMERPEFRHALFGIEFYSLDTGQPIYTLNADKLFTPGSTTKLLTEGTALELLGADFRFRTRIYRTGTIAPDGTLDGDLVLVASGDPNLSGRIRPDGTLAFENEDHSYDGDPNTRAVPGDPLLVIRQLAQQIAAHVKKIRGHVLVDTSLFPEGDRELGTGVVISPVVVNDNLIDLTIGPGASEGATALVRQSPTTSYANFINQVTTGKSDSKPAIRFASDVTKPDGAHTVTVAGSFPAGKQAILYKYAVPEPTRFAETVLREALRERGVSVEMSGPDAKPDFKALSYSYVSDHLIAEHVSPPLKEEIKVTLKVSQNLHASSTPLILSAVLAPNDKTKTGFDLEREFLARAGLDLTGAQQGDGAGGNAHFTPDFMVSFLAYMARQKNYQDFLKALPILGRDGTLFDIQPASPAAGHVFAKTGTYGVGDPLNRRLLVTGKGLAGYMTTVGGQHLAFAIYVNNVSVPLEPDAIKQITGQALGEIAAAAYETAR
ncbi:MAG: D-alanyl-D-alanine carboxypeptidase/D-alanyl-D-alanine endopeptidase [Pyrinomonadaceae bacterium]